MQENKRERGNFHEKIEKIEHWKSSGDGDEIFRNVGGEGSIDVGKGSWYNAYIYTV